MDCDALVETMIEAEIDRTMQAEIDLSIQAMMEQIEHAAMMAAARGEPAYLGLAESRRALDIAKAIKSRMQALEDAMTYAPDDATKTMLARCMVEVALGRLDFAASVCPGAPAAVSDMSPAVGLLSTPHTSLQPRVGGAASSSVSPPRACALTFDMEEGGCGT